MTHWIPNRGDCFAAIGIVKGKPFNPDARMKRLLTEAATIGDATARATLYSPREKGYFIYPDSDSSWVMGFANKDVFFEVDGAATSTPAPASTLATPASLRRWHSRVPERLDYGIALKDADKKAFDGTKTYKLHLPPNVPVNNFWAVTIYDTQTRSMLQTSQSSHQSAARAKDSRRMPDGSYDVYFAPKAPKGKKSNWLQTLPGKSWFCILRMYGPLEPWINKTLRPARSNS